MLESDDIHSDDDFIDSGAIIENNNENDAEYEIDENDAAEPDEIIREHANSINAELVQSAHLARQLEMVRENISAEQRESLRQTAVDLENDPRVKDMLRKKHMYRKYPTAHRREFTKIGKHYFHQVSVAIQSQNENEIDHSIVDLLHVPSKACLRLRGGKGKAKQKKYDAMSKTLNNVIIEMKRPGPVTRQQTSSNTPPNPNTNRPPADDVNVRLSRKIEAVKSLVEDNYLSKAIQRLNAPHDIEIKPYDRLLNELRELHPQKSSNIPPLPSNLPDLIAIDPDDPKFIRILKRMDNGSCPGLSGWSGNMISILADDEDCRRYLAHLLSTMLNGLLPETSRILLLTSLLTPVPKPNGTTRPITMGELFYRIASAYALQMVPSETINNFFLPHQYGVKVSGGCEIVIHSLQQKLSSPDKPRYCLKIDMKNAFNCLDREYMMKSLFAKNEFSSLFRMAHWCYKSPTPLVMRNENGQLCFNPDLFSCQGTRQGGNEASILFAIPVQDVLNKIKHQYPEIDILAILDDVHLISDDPDELIHAFIKLADILATELSLHIQPTKCSFTYFNCTPNVDVLDVFDKRYNIIGADIDNEGVVKTSVRGRLKQHKIPINVDAAFVLGSAIGINGSKVKQELLKEFSFTSLEKTLHVLSHSQLPVQYAMLLLRLCIVPKLTYIMRTVPPTFLSEITHQFDQLITSTAAHLLRLLDVSEDDLPLKHLLTYFSLPCSYGGFGLTNTHLISKFAYLDSISRCISFDKNWLNMFEPTPTPFVSKSILQALSIQYRFEGLNKYLPNTVTDFLHKYTSHNPDPYGDLIDEDETLKLRKSLQSKLSYAAYNKLHTQLVDNWKEKDNSNTMFHLARMNSIRAPGASKWKTAVPCEQACRLNNSDYIIAAKMNVGVKPFDIMPSMCSRCNKVIGSSGVDSLHALSCQYLKGKQVTHRHDQIQHVLETVAARTNIPTQKHQHTYRYIKDHINHTHQNQPLSQNSQLDCRKVDLTFLFSDTLVDVDIVVSHPTCHSYVENAAKSTLYAASHAHFHKHSKHDLALMDEPFTEQQLKDREIILFKSFSVETYGGLHWEAREIIDHIVLCTENHTLPFTRYELVTTLRYHIACAIVRGNAQILRATQNTTLHSWMNRSLNSS